MLVAVVPGDPIRLASQHRIRMADDWVRAPVQAVSAVRLVALQYAFPVSPHFQRGFQIGWPATVCLDAHDRLMSVHPHAQLRGSRALAEADRHLAQAQVEFLPERTVDRQGTGSDADADSPEFEQAAVPAPGVRLTQQQDQIAARLDPRVHSQIAVAERHRTGRVFAGRVPNDVISGQLRRRVRLAFIGGCRGLQPKKHAEPYHHNAVVCHNGTSPVL
jgi:hypothetical protein